MTIDRPLILDVLADNIPVELKEVGQWVLWRLERRRQRWTKIPYQTSGLLASSIDSHTWTTFGEANTAREMGPWDGLGFVFTSNDRYVGIDEDNCRNPKTGAIAPWAERVTRSIDSYTEVSPSGTGLKVFAKGYLPAGRRRQGDLEMYDSRRFFTVTGHHLGGTPRVVEERGPDLHSLHGEVFGAKVQAAMIAERQRNLPGGMSDTTIIALAMTASNGTAFSRLWAGDICGYPSSSEADLALCSHLAFYAGGDGTAIDRLFRRSGLYREKWDARHFGDGRTYGEATIEKAVGGDPSAFGPRCSRKVPRVTVSVFP